MKIHFLGIGGSGASAAAAIAQAQGYEITGCDLEPNNKFTLHIGSVKLEKGHSASHIGSGKVDILAVTPAIFSLDPNNSELLAAKEKKIPVITWQQFVGEYLTNDKFVIAVCGTHGKTTTTAMIAQMLEDANLDPTVLLGAIHPKWGTNYRIQRQTTNGRGYFAIEADEFNDNFLHLKPDITVVTNIEMDHPEYFKDFESYKESFEKFLLQSKQTIVANLSDSNVAEVVKHVMKTPRQKHSDHDDFVQYLDYSRNELHFPMQIPGEFNKLNAQAAMQVGLLLEIDPQTIRQSLQNYSGVGRRFEYLGDYNNAKVYSDFGHHPTEIKVTMEAARQKFPNNRIILIYEPHMFSRTKALFDDFVKVFKELPVDKIIITDIYPSREVDTGLVNSQQLVESINSEVVPKVRNSVKMVPINQILNEVKAEVKNGDVVFFMGAGDIDKLPRKLVSSS
ncbi:UDP-N-acetylmuramate--L-alanine ligase [Candidatus Daviesbacteria bacterium]|nr:UDP-N-acetylmuramate--L-alanine ligase [Candidatus Daviesbacteria bacterium]